jgi:formylglycine-generating enzyme required for sulfatase activity
VIRPLALVAFIGVLGCSSSSENESEQFPCPKGKGATMVRAESFDEKTYCIDSTETSWGEYQVFLDSFEAELGPQPDECGWNDKQYVPHILGPTEPGPNPNGDPALPVVGVDWCDAFAYCDWAGKRMCGKIGGGGVPFDQQNDASQSQWYSACSAGGKTVYSYGNDYDPTKCNNFDYGAGALIAANTTTCEGGFPKLYNMSGNAWEWENSCNGGSTMDDPCWVRSGQYNNSADFIECDYDGFNAARTFTSDSISIRCCGP